MKRLVGATAFILLLAACGGDDSGTVTTVGGATTTTAAADTTTTSAVDATTTTADGSTTTAPAETTTTSSPTTVPASGARFALVEVGLGGLGQVFIQNVGDAPGSLAGFWLCQRPAYHEMPDVTLQPGEVAQMFVSGHDDTFLPRDGVTFIDEVANTGPFNPETGEIGLYNSNSFGSPDAIVSYVEWGDAGHGRSDTAVAAGIWADGGFVATTADSGAILATTIPPTDPSHWFGG